MQTSNKYGSAHGLQGARFIRPDQVASAFAAPLFGALRQGKYIFECPSHRGRGQRVTHSYGDSFQIVERTDCRRTLIGQKHFQLPFNLRQNRRAMLRV